VYLSVLGLMLTSAHFPCNADSFATLIRPASRVSGSPGLCDRVGWWLQRKLTAAGSCALLKISIGRRDTAQNRANRSLYFNFGNSSPGSRLTANLERPAFGGDGRVHPAMRVPTAPSHQSLSTLMGLHQTRW
jgi:hypothetical protein